jgi:tight adherence protein B
MSFDAAMALRYLSGVINAGGSVDEALRALVEEAPGPLRSAVMQRLAGAGASASVQERAKRLFFEPEFRLGQASLILAHETGGSVGKLLERCARHLEDRRRWIERRNAMSSQTVVTAWVVGAMPAGLMVILGWVAPDYLRPLFHTTLGHSVLAIAAALLGLGAWCIYRLVRNHG